MNNENEITYKDVVVIALLHSLVCFTVMIPASVFISWHVFGPVTDFHELTWALSGPAFIAVCWFRLLHDKGCEIHGVPKAKPEA